MVVLLFIDGVGVGARRPANPLDGCGSPYFGFFEGERFEAPRDGTFTTLDARLGVEGTPQSATGQATIITGENAAALLGRHQSGFPGGSLRPLLRDRSLFRRLAGRGLRVAHANVAASRVARRRWRAVSATAVAAEEAGLRPRTLEDLAAGHALHHEFTNEALAAYGYDVRPLTPSEAGRRLARIAAEHDFCAFEYFMTDAAGHAQDFAAARRHLARLSEFLDALLDEVDLARSTVLLVSDHGNLEDLSTGAHTLNPVPLLGWGPGVANPLARARSLADVAPIVEALEEKR